MLLKTHNIRVKSKHIIHTFVLKRLDIDCFVLGQFDQITDLVIFRDQIVINIVEGEIKRVNTHRFFELTHRNHIDLTQGVTRFQRHHIVE